MEYLISVLKNGVKPQVVIKQVANTKVLKGGCLTLFHMSIVLSCLRFHEASGFTALF